MSTKFIKRVEDFVCDKCGTIVKGGGYTNHCPKCLWSKHVDINPGDRASECSGLMQPVSFFKKNGEDKITHRCIKCGQEKINRVQVGDDVEALIALTNK